LYAYEQVVAEQRHVDTACDGACDAIHAQHCSGEEPDLVALSAEVGAGPVLGLWVGVDDAPTATAPEVTDCGFGCSYALWVVGVKRHQAVASTMFG
jgi:hypothetical protein